MKNLSAAFTCLAVAACAAGIASMAACGGSSVSPVSPTPVSFSAVGTGSSGALSANGAAAEADADQPPGAIGGFDSHEPAPDPQLFDGTYTGSATGGFATLAFTVTNGNIAVTVTGVDEPWVTVFSGAVSASGAITASSTSGTCSVAVTLTGQITIASSGEATVTGTWSDPPGGPNCAGSVTWTAIRTTPTPTPTPPNLTGVWASTERTLIVVSFQHSGTTLTGTLTTPPNYGSFALTQVASSGTTLTFSGTFLINPDGTERCPQVGRPGTMTVNTATNTMTGSFTGVNFDCQMETNIFEFRKT